MKILHICFVGPYNEGWTYQENMLSKYHARLGYEVSLICIPKEFVQGKIKNSMDTEYINQDGVRVIRMKERLNLGDKLVWYKDVRKTLDRISPDVLFVHGCQFMDAGIVAKYVVQHSNVKMYVDNHCDYSNSATNLLSKYILHKIFWKNCAQTLLPVTEKFYGVLPARVDFLTDLYHIPKEKCELLVMGGDDDYIKLAATKQSVDAIRVRHGIAEQDFLIVTGGKIDKFKTQTLLLMQAIKEIPNENLKLILFGAIDEELRGRVEELTDGVRIQNAGWIKPNDSYSYFAAADLVVFPGRHSVFWEQAVGQEVPLLVKYWDGTTHVDCGGNVEFLYHDSVDEIKEKLEKIMSESFYSNMKIIAKKVSGTFKYSEIAKKSVEDSLH